MERFAKSKTVQRQELKVGQRQEALERANLRESQKQIIRDQREEEEAFEEQKADIRRQETEGFLSGLRSNVIGETVASQQQAQRFLR